MQASSSPVQVNPCRAAIERYWPMQTRSQALSIAQAESGFRADATGYNTNGTVDRGCMQINSIHAKRVNGNLLALYDANINVQVGLQIYREQGFYPWVTAHKLGIVK